MLKEIILFFNNFYSYKMSENVYIQPYGIVTMAMTVLGIVVNVSSIVLLCKKKRNSMFHTLLKVIKPKNIYTASKIPFSHPKFK